MKEIEIEQWAEKRSQDFTRIQHIAKSCLIEGFIAGAKSQSMSEWVSGDISPEPLKTVLADYGNGLLCTSFYNSNKWFCHIKEWNEMKPVIWAYAHSFLPPPPQTSK